MMRNLIKMPRLKARVKNLWNSIDTCYYSIQDIPEETIKYALYDLDNTLLKLDSMEPICSVIEHAKSHIAQGYHVGVISNQYGITRGKTTHEQVRARFSYLKGILGAISCIYATGKDMYRKPMIGMFKVLVNEKPISSDSFYCGDATGRAKDFSICDYLFSKNCKLKFLTAPDLLTEYKTSPKHDLYANFDPASYLRNIEWSYPMSTNKKAIILVGPQGSGKSTYAKSSNLRVLSLENLNGSSTKFKAGFNQLIKNQESYISELKKHEYDVFCVFFNFPKELSSHMCNLRQQLGGKYIPIIARHTYYKRLQPPLMDEGYNDIITIDGISCSSAMDAAFYYRYDLKQ